jgi:hypothetical protein
MVCSGAWCKALDNHGACWPYLKYIGYSNSGRKRERAKKQRPLLDAAVQTEELALLLLLLLLL